MFDDKEKHRAILKSIGAKIKSSRLKKGIRQNEVAYRCNFDKSSYSNIEAGKRNITLITLFKIAHALEVDVSQLIEDNKIN